MLSVRNLVRLHLGPVSFDLAPGECIALRGASGAGKSLLLRAIADLDPNEGQVSLDGRSREAMPAPQWRAKVCYVAAEPGWWADEVAAHFPDWSRAAPLAEALLLPPDIVERPIARLSTGERQRLALIRAVVRQPRVLLLDEPTAALDEAARAAAEDMIARWRQDGRSVLWVSHDAAQAQRVAARRLTIADGKLEAAP